MNMFEIAHSLHRQFGGDPWCIYRGKHLVSFADNHDVTRLASILTCKEHLRGAYGVLFGMPGIRRPYYGSEWGQLGRRVPATWQTWRFAPSLTPGGRRPGASSRRREGGGAPTSSPDTSASSTMFAAHRGRCATALIATW